VLAAQCDDAYSAADDAYSYARRGYRSGDLDDIQRYAKRAMNSAEEAMSYADDCDCDDAESYIRKAMRSADDAMSYASDCN